MYFEFLRLKVFSYFTFRDIVVAVVPPGDTYPPQIFLNVVFIILYGWLLVGILGVLVGVLGVFVGLLGILVAILGLLFDVLGF